MLAISLSGQNKLTETKSFGNITRNTKSNTVQNVICMPDTVYHHDPFQAVVTLLTLYKNDFFGTTNPSYRLERTTTTPSGTQLRFQQHINNVPVIGGGIVAAVTNSGVISTVSNHYQTSIHQNTPSLTPTLDSSQAIAVAEEHLQVSHLQYESSIDGMFLNPIFHALVWHIVSEDSTGNLVIVELDAHSGQVYGAYSTVLGSVDGHGNVFAPDPGSFYQPDCWTSNCIDSLNLDGAVIIKPLQRLNPPVNGLYALNGIYAWSPDSINKMTTPDFFVSPYEYYAGTYANPTIYPMGEINMYYHIDNIISKVHQLGFNPQWKVYGQPGFLSSKVNFFLREVGAAMEPNDGRNAYCSYNEAVMCYGIGSFDQSVIAHELGHALHDSYLEFLTPYHMNNGDNHGISEGFADYLGISYRRQFNSEYRPNARFTYFSPEQPESILPPDSCNFQNMWQHSNVYTKLRPYASALMDLEYNIATNPQAGVRLGQDTVLTLRLDGFSRSKNSETLLINILNMYQADIDIYNGDHLQDLIEVYHSRKLFYSNSTQILEQNVTSNQSLANYFLLKDNRRIINGATLTIEDNSRIVLGSDFTIENGAAMVVGNNSRFFNRHLHHTIHVYGTLQIAGNTKLPANIVVYNGGKLLINEEVIFAKQPGTTITIKSGGKVESNGLGTLLNITDGWVIEQGTIFENLGNSNRNYGVILEPATELTLLNTTFINTNIQGIGNFTFEECSFTSSDLTVIAEEISVDSCVFDSCTVSASVRSLNPTYAEIQNCSFFNGERSYAIQLSGYNEYNVSGNLIEDNGNGGISISNCGLLNPNTHLIGDNIIENNSGGEALRLYNSSASIIGNTISGNSHGIGFYHNCLIKSFGDEEAPQTISYNGNVQVQAVDNSFPWYFSYNIIEANTTDTLINCFYNTDNGGTDEKYDVTMNCWASDFDPETQLIPFKSFLWSPTWDCFTIGTLNYNSPEEALMHEGYNALSENNIPVAKQNFEQIIAQYPQSQFAKAALKSLRSIYHTQGYSLQDFMQYLNNETATSSSSELQKITGYFRAETNLTLGNDQSALDFYQSVIDNPDTPADEIYATIDAEYAGLDIGHKALNINTFTKMMSSTEAHNKKRNMLLDGLRTNQTQDFGKSVVENEVDFTISPNPAKSFIDITLFNAPKGNTTINIVSIDGRKIASQTIQENSEELKTFRMMLPELNHGLYLVSVVFENNLKIVKKVVVK